MRAEAPLPVVRPRLLLVDFLSQDIQRAAHSVYGTPKPYSTIAVDRLVLHNVLVPRPDRAGTSADLIRRIAGHSLIVDRAMARFAPESWYAAPSHRYVRISNEPREVTCRLLQRLKRRAETSEARVLLVMQHGGGEISRSDGPDRDAVAVAACARAMGIQVVDEFASLKQVHHTSPAELTSFYVMSGDLYGHMSARGTATSPG